MTYRLVGLMSLVLLLSLAAFALLMSSYHQEVMDEVHNTISAVGRATLKSFEFGPMDTHAVSASGLDEASRGLWTFREKGAIASDDGGVWVDESHDRATNVVPEDHAVGIVFQRRPSPLHMLAAECDPSAVVEFQVARHRTTSDVVHFSEDADGKPLGGNRVFVRVQEIRAEEDPAHGTFLHIPTLRSEEKDTEARVEGPPPDEEAFTVTANASFPAKLALTRQDIVLPISTTEFQDLFTAFRGRTLFLFLGVFLVGTVLSASLASRFTRPVRRLDAGIRRLTEGDLEVEVQADGKDEMGRLGRAFNEMTRRLRVSRERERELTRRERLSALGRLVAGVAHDVRNPLHAIGLTLQNLQETSRPVDEVRGQEFDHSLAIIREEIHRLDRLVENFLRFSRTERRDPVNADLLRLLRETAQLVEKEAERRGIAVDVVADETIPQVPVDVESIRSSILNLVLNSFESMTEGGTVTLTARCRDGEVVLEVADTGKGIPEADQERVFDFAYTTREDGHGLGLAMVHQVVVEDHGGRVSLESRPGEGTRVRLGLPVDPGEAPS